LCFLQIFSDGRHQDTSTILTFDGTYVNDISCSCTLPSNRRRREADSDRVIADGYYMSVSNDGTTFSDEITLINCDSACYECNVTAVTCLQLVRKHTKFCFIRKSLPTNSKTSCDVIINSTTTWVIHV